jgi:AraC family transcriptional regulator, exoenzyme S synthesis regulatory protein ExsA
VLNLYGRIRNYPGIYRQFSCRDTLISVFNCPLENKYQDAWSEYNYIVYVVSGKKTWHTSNASYELSEGSCVFVKKGAAIVEQFLDVAVCLVIFFLPDDFITDVLKEKKATRVEASEYKHLPIIPIDGTNTIHSFFQSMMAYFDAGHEPDPVLLELKFRELILTTAGNPRNGELLSYFSTLMQQPHAISLQRVMEENFCYNLKLHEFARLSNRSLSAFKRDFQKLYKTTPGKWLTEKRLDHALHLLAHMNRTIGEAAFESGFESPSHFSRAFRLRFGKSPAAMKQQMAM